MPGKKQEQKKNTFNRTKQEEDKCILTVNTAGAHMSPSGAQPIDRSC